MFCVFSVLLVLDTLAPSLAKGFMDFFEPATLFIQRWLPLFYVPSLVVLPLAVRDIPAASGLKIGLITCTYMHLNSSAPIFCCFFQKNAGTDGGAIDGLFFYSWRLVCFADGGRIHGAGGEEGRQDGAHRGGAHEQAVRIRDARVLGVGRRLRGLVRHGVREPHGAWHHGQDLPAFPARFHCAGIHGWFWVILSAFHYVRLLLT